MNAIIQDDLHPTRNHVIHATHDGFVKAIKSAMVGDAFSWETTGQNNSPALLFLGVHQGHFFRPAGYPSMSQDTWFEFNEDLTEVTYVVRLVDHPSGDSRGILESKVTLEEAADLLEICIEQVLAEKALRDQRDAQARRRYS